MSEPTDIAELIRKFGEMGKLSLCIEAADELDRLRRRLEIAEQSMREAIEFLGASDPWPTTAAGILQDALDEMRKADE